MRTKKRSFLLVVCYMVWACGGLTYSHINMEQEKGLGPTVVGPLTCGSVWEVGGLIRGNSHLASEQSGEPGWRNADKKVNCDGPEKEAAAICGAFVRHTPLFHP